VASDKKSNVKSEQRGERRGGREKKDTSALAKVFLVRGRCIGKRGPSPDFLLVRKRGRKQKLEDSVSSLSGKRITGTWLELDDLRRVVLRAL